MAIVDDPFEGDSNDRKWDTGKVIAPHFLIILNRRAARKRIKLFEQVLTLLDAAGCTYIIRETHAAGDAARFAREATADVVDAVVVAGGDGTINDTVNGFDATSPPLGLIPLGTANVLAHEIGLKIEPDIIAETLIGGQRLSVVPGHVNGRVFMMMVGAGFDAHVVRGIPGALKRRLGKIVYVFSAINQLIRYPCPHLSVTLDGRPVTASTVVVSRGRLYGGRFIMAPDAKLETPELHVSLFPRKGRLAMAAYCLALPLGLLNRWNLIGHVTGRCIEIHDASNGPVQADGDIATTLPATIKLVDYSIVILVANRD
ncbi:MAG: YegS/Rv2252/BmrU family lipid kinase [Alphaproteobacteria bacterium]|nr:YegS/Rv2252/BmrU family lipid kinase [Alphaproteobacteria bacterium]